VKKGCKKGEMKSGAAKILTSKTKGEKVKVGDEREERGRFHPPHIALRRLLQMPAEY
jgi:hypothetical protein